jgi:hypothetical protein
MTEVKEEVKIGKYKSTKFSKFVGLSHSSRYISNKAKLDLSKVFGIGFEDVVVEIELHGNGTYDITEIETSKLTDSNIESLIFDLEHAETANYGLMLVLKDYTFYLIDTISHAGQDKNIKTNLYLEINKIKPINRLRNLLHEEEDIEEVKIKSIEIPLIISKKQKSFLDDLLSDIDEVESDVVVEDKVEEKKEEPNPKSHLIETFEKIKLEKSQDLKDRIEKAKSDMHKASHELENSQSKFDKLKGDIQLLEHRLDDMDVYEDKLNCYFFVSEQIKGVDVDDNTKSVVNRIAPILQIKKVDKLLEFLTKGYYLIKISKYSDKVEIEDVKEQIELIKKLQSVDPTSLFQPTSNFGEFEYRGDLTWHQLIKRMIRTGFEQNSQFDELCKAKEVKEIED